VKKAKKAAALLLAAGCLLMTSQSAFAVVGGPKAKSPDEMVITVVQEGEENGGSTGGPKVVDPNLHFIQIGSSDLAHLEGHWSKGSLAHLLKAGVMTKGETANFDPGVPIGKVEFRSWISRILGNKSSDDSAEPAEKVTRLDAAVWLAKLLPALNTGINGENLQYPFTDTDGITKEQKEAIHYLYKLGIMIGDGQGRFLPNASLTNGEAVVLLDKVLSRAMQMTVPAKYEIVTGTLPESVHTLVEENKSQPGVYSVVDGGVRYLVIAGGEVPNGGYKINLNHVRETDGALMISADLQAPADGTPVSTVVSYPVLVLKMNKSNKPVFLLD
jgi:hypothetical protein